MRRRTLLRALAIAALALAGALMLWTQPPAITQELAYRIHEGMTRTDVEALLGAAGDYSTGPLVVLQLGGLFDPIVYAQVMSAPDYGSASLWVTDTGFVEIRFDEDNRVTSCLFSPLLRLEQGPLQNLLWRAKRQWRKWFR